MLFFVGVGFKGEGCWVQGRGVGVGGEGYILLSHCSLGCIEGVQIIPWHPLQLKEVMAC